MTSPEPTVIVNGGYCLKCGSAFEAFRHVPNRGVWTDYAFPVVVPALLLRKHWREAYSGCCNAEISLQTEPNEDPDAIVVRCADDCTTCYGDLRKGNDALSLSSRILSDQVNA